MCLFYDSALIFAILLTPLTAEFLLVEQNYCIYNNVKCQPSKIICCRLLDCNPEHQLSIIANSYAVKTYAYIMCNIFQNM